MRIHTQPSRFGHAARSSVAVAVVVAAAHWPRTDLAIVAAGLALLLLTADAPS